MASAQKIPKKAVPAKGGAKQEGAKPRSLGGRLPLPERDALQIMQNDELRRSQMELEAARDRYAALYDFSPAGHLTLDSHGTIVEANLRAGTLLGVNQKELIGQSLGHFVARDDQDTLHRHCQEVFKTGTRQSCEVRLTEKPDASCSVHLESIAMHEEPGHSAHWRTALLDITERRRAEQEQARLIEDLTRSQKHFQSLFHWIPSAVGISTVVDGRFIDVNEGFSRLTGYTREEVIGRTTLELGMWVDPSQRAIVLQEIQKQGSLHNREGLLRTKSGEIRSLMISLHPIQLGPTPCLIYLAHDITDRKRAEEALRKSEDRYRALYQDSPFMYFTVSADRTILSVNQLGAESLGFRAEELIGRSVLSIFHEEDRAAAHVSLDRSLANPTDLATWEFRKVRKDGTILWVRETVRLVEDDCGALVMLLACEDITERKRAEAVIRESESRFRVMADTAPTLIWMSGLDKLCTYFNQVWLDYTGRTMEQELGNGWAV